MKHDIDAINVALRLGDSPILPIGAVIRMFGTENCYRVLKVMKWCPGMYEMEVCYIKDWCALPYGSTLKLCVPIAYEFIFIPEDAPLFGEWARI
jgi:hypothetical protein